MNPSGKILGDICQFSRVCSTFKEQIGKQLRQMPEDMLELIIQTSSKEWSLVLNSFGGIGTTFVNAKKLKRKYITIEISE